MAKKREFTTVLHEEVQRRRLRFKDVMACVHCLHSEVFDRFNGAGNEDNFGGIIFVSDDKFSDNERAALVSFLRVQSRWENPVYWKEVPECLRGPVFSTFRGHRRARRATRVGSLGPLGPLNPYHIPIFDPCEPPRRPSSWRPWGPARYERHFSVGDRDYESYQ